MNTQIDVSVLILTYNEEKNIANCLASLGWCDDIAVLDSYSTDQTELIARTKGARFVQRVFDDYASQRNFGINRIEYKHAWLLMVDADEAVTPELAREIGMTVQNCSEDMCLYRFRRKDYFLGRWIRHSSGYPTWFGRLMRVGRVKVERAINEEYYSDGQIGFLQQHLLHYPFNKGFHAWFEKHNRYSSMEAEAKVQGRADQFRWIDFRDADPAIRRKATKTFVYSLPGRPLLIFLALYFVKGGFLEGRSGLTFCLLRSFYEYMINCKIIELKRRRNGQQL